MVSGAKMEFHWYENYYKTPHGMPNNLERSHSFAIGFYMTARLVRIGTEFIHSDQSFFFSMSTLMSGYVLFAHFANEPFGRSSSVRNSRMGRRLYRVSILSGCCFRVRSERFPITTNHKG